MSAPAPERWDEQEYTLERMAADLPDEATDGEWIGMLRARPEGTEWLLSALDAVLAEPDHERLDMSAVFERVLAEHPGSVGVVYVSGDWIDINDLADVARSGGV